MPLASRLRRELERSLRAALLAATASIPAAAQSVPDRLADTTFWRLMTDYSEPWGTFRSENLVSNETSLQWVIPDLAAGIAPGSVYLGVAPDQNFTYIVALKPSIAFIVDIRHQNAIQHLMYKALIEMSANRAEFVATLFSRPPLTSVDSSAAPVALMQALAAAGPADSARFRQNLAAIKDRLVRIHGFAMSDSELVSLNCVYGSFFAQGPGLTYNYSTECRNPGAFGRGFGGGAYRAGGGLFGMPTWLNMIDENDGAGHNRSYLASEANFRAIKAMQERNLIVPLTGNFAGDKTLRRVGAYAREHGARIGAFYVSNVEQYLFMDDGLAGDFYRNVATLPIDSASTFIRSFSLGGFGAAPSGPLKQQSGRSLQLVSSIVETVRAFQAGILYSYFHVVQFSRQ